MDDRHLQVVHAGLHRRGVQLVEGGGGGGGDEPLLLLLLDTLKKADGIWKQKR